MGGIYGELRDVGSESGEGLGRAAGSCSEGEEGEVAYCELVWFVEEDGVVGLGVGG
jgi:hypothetical protein